MNIDSDNVINEYLLTSADDLPRLFKLLRQKQGATQKELAEKIGISHKTFSSLERKLNAASFSRAIELMDLLGYQLVIRQKSQPIKSLKTQ